MFRDEVTIMDATEVILLMDMTMPSKDKIFKTICNSRIGLSNNNSSADYHDEIFQYGSLLQSNFPDNILLNHQNSCDYRINSIASQETIKTTNVFLSCC